jgi:hypothetical protein
MKISWSRKSDPSHQSERGVIEPLLRGNKMENGKRMATPKQLAYIESLCMANGATVERGADMSMAEASELIGGLLQKVNNGDQEMMIKRGNRRNDFNSGARLGMAFKCCYRRWVSGGRNIFKYRNDFIQNVIDTFDLINEIAEKALEAPA